MGTSREVNWTREEASSHCLRTASISEKNQEQNYVVNDKMHKKLFLIKKVKSNVFQVQTTQGMVIWYMEFGNKTLKSVLR